MSYISDETLAAYIGAEKNPDPTRLGYARLAAERYVDSKCGRTFAADSTATDRYFFPRTCYTLPIDDAWAITAVATDTSADGTYATSVASTAYQTYPLNGVGPNGATGWPTDKLVLHATTWPTLFATNRPPVKVTAKWGWAAVPDDVIQACLLLGQRVYKLKEIPFGNIENTEIGPIPARQLSDIDKLLSDYMTLSAAGSKFMVA